MSAGQCLTCGASFEDGRLFCGQCGSRVLVGVVDLEKYRTSPERYERVAVAPTYAASLRYAPPFSAVREVARPLVYLAATVAAWLWFVTRGLFEAPQQVMLGFFVIGGAWLILCTLAVVAVLRRIAARTKPIIVVVETDSFTKRDPAGRCDRHITVRERSGRQRKLFAPGVVMGQVGRGDIGIAYVRADRLLDFRWFDIMAPRIESGEMPRSPGCATCGGPQRFGPISDHCTYCGAPLPEPDLGEFGARFRAAAASPTAAAAARRHVSGGLPSLLPALLIIAGGVFYLYAAYWMRELLAAAIKLSWWGLLAPVLFGIPIAIGIVKLAARLRPHLAPRINMLVVVVRTREELVSKDGDSETFRFFATVAGPSGARREFRIMQNRAQKLTRGELGVAHIRGNWLADFTALP